MKLLLVSLPLFCLFYTIGIRGSLGVPSKILHLLLLLILLLSGRPFIHAAPIPFECAGNLIIVEGTVNGHTGNFLLDTGSPFMILNSAIFSGTISRYNKEEMVDIHGEVAALEILFVQSASIYGHILHNSIAKVLDLSYYEATKKIALAGIIGYDSFRDKELLFDFENCQLLLLDPLAVISTGKYERLDSMEIVLNHHIPCIRIGFDGKKCWFALDSGSEVNLLHLYELKGRHEFFRGSGRILLRGLGTTPKKQSKGWLYNLEIGQGPPDSLEVTLTDLNTLNETLKFPLDGLLGIAFFKQNLVSINYRHNKFYFLKQVENLAETKP